MSEKTDGAIRGYQVLDFYMSDVDPQPGDSHLSALARVMGDLVLASRDLEVVPADLVAEVTFGMELRAMDAQAFE
jgi:hypothetical protein